MSAPDQPAAAAYESDLVADVLRDILDSFALPAERDACVDLMLSETSGLRIELQ